MELPVYTSLLRVERRLYEIGQFELPRPVTLPEAGVFSGSFLALVLGAHLLGIGFSAAWAWVYLVLPWLATRLAAQPLADRKRVDLWARSQLRHLLAEPRLLARLHPVREPRQLRLRVRVWQPRSAAAAIAPITGRRERRPIQAVPSATQAAPAATSRVIWPASRPSEATHPLGTGVARHLRLSTRWADPSEERA
jgi:conjugation transfer TcpE-like protein